MPHVVNESPSECHSERDCPPSSNKASPQNIVWGLLFGPVVENPKAEGVIFGWVSFWIFTEKPFPTEESRDKSGEDISNLAIVSKDAHF